MQSIADQIDTPFVQAALTQLREARLAPIVAAGVLPSRRAMTTWVGDLQQGDGGKGAMADRLAAHHQIVVRVQGGDNAGHTTVFRSESGRDIVVKNHILPSGMRQPETIGVLANGVLINAERLADELETFSAAVPDVRDRLVVSTRAHLILPLHIDVDRKQERLRSDKAIGTTKRGIGPANVCKINRIGLRVADLRDPDIVRERISAAVDFFGLDESEIDRNIEWIEHHRPLLLERAVDTSRLIDDLVATGHSVLFEGAQGPLIDFEQGIYPFVTTSPTTVHSVGSGSGLDVSRVQNRIGVLKVYQTMVGSGAFVSEDHGAVGDRLRALGEEVGTTTGRDRRCGWLDLVQARWAVGVNRFTSVVLTKLDVLDTFDSIGLCVGYERNGELLIEFDAEHASLQTCTPVYRYFDGWLTSTAACTSFEDLPLEARRFIEFIGGQLNVEIGAVTVGPRDTDILCRPGTRFSSVVAA